MEDEKYKCHVAGSGGEWKVERKGGKSMRRGSEREREATWRDLEGRSKGEERKNTGQDEL